MIDLSDSPCPSCGQTANSSVLHETTYPEHGYPGRFALRRCGGCGLLFNSPRLDGDELAGLYGRNYYFFLRSDAREFDRIVVMYQRTIALIDAAALPEKRCIDIGCGRGYPGCWTSPATPTSRPTWRIARRSSRHSLPASLTG